MNSSTLITLLQRIDTWLDFESCTVPMLSSSAFDQDNPEPEFPYPNKLSIVKSTKISKIFWKNPYELERNDNIMFVPKDLAHGEDDPTIPRGLVMTFDWRFDCRKSCLSYDAHWLALCNSRYSDIAIMDLKASYASRFKVQLINITDQEKDRVTDLAFSSDSLTLIAQQNRQNKMYAIIRFNGKKWEKVQEIFLKSNPYFYRLDFLNDGLNENLVLYYGSPGLDIEKLCETAVKFVPIDSDENHYYYRQLLPPGGGADQFSKVCVFEKDRSRLVLESYVSVSPTWTENNNLTSKHFPKVMLLQNRHCYSISTDGQKIAIAKLKGTIKLFDLKKTQKRFDRIPDNDTVTLEYECQGSVIFHDPGNIYYDHKTMEDDVYFFNVYPTETRYIHIRFHPSNHRYLCAANEFTAIIFDLSTNSKVIEISTTSKKKEMNYGAPIIDIQWQSSYLVLQTKAEFHIIKFGTGMDFKSFVNKTIFTIGAAKLYNGSGIEAIIIPLVHNQLSAYGYTEDQWPQIQQWIQYKLAIYPTQHDDGGGWTKVLRKLPKGKSQTPERSAVTVEP